MTLGARFLLLCGQVGTGVTWCALVAAYSAFIGIAVQPTRRSMPPPLARTLGELASLSPLPLVAVVVAAAKMGAGRRGYVVWPSSLVTALAIAELLLAIALVWRHRSRLALAAGFAGFGGALMVIVWVVSLLAISDETL